MEGADKHNYDFRNQSVTPTLKDMYNQDDLWMCNCLNDYVSVDDYLEVQFRVLREDFMSPLRNGLNKFLNDGDETDQQELRVYRNVRLFIPTDNKNTKCCDRIKIFFGKLDNIDWDECQLFTPGGLLLLSRDGENLYSYYFRVFILIHTLHVKK